MAPLSKRSDNNSINGGTRGRGRMSRSRRNSAASNATPDNPGSRRSSIAGNNDGSPGKNGAEAQPSIVMNKKELVYHGQGKRAVEDWGYPGFLTEEEYLVYEQFREEVYRRDEAFRSTVFCFRDAHEEEAYALCRWLRARKFNLAETIQMIVEATECRSEPFKNDFHPDPRAALGVEPSIYISQYPQQYSGFARNGCPIFISKPSELDVGGVECMTTVEGILNYHWFAMMHDYVYRLQQALKRDPAFKRYELVYIMDLDGLTAGQVSKRALNLIKIQSQIDSLCFPETLYRLIIINAPSFFSMTWKIVKNWIDARTANKVEIHSNRTKWVKRLRELVSDENLPCNYGGKGPPSEVSLWRYCMEIDSFKERDRQKKLGGKGNSVNNDDGKKPVRLIAKTLSVRSSASLSATISEGEMMKVSTFTRSLKGGKLHITSAGGRRLNSDGVAVKHNGIGVDEESPTRIDLDYVLQEAGTYKLKIESSSGPFNSENFLVVCEIFDSKRGAAQELGSLNGEVASGQDNLESNSTPVSTPVCCDDFMPNDDRRKDTDDGAMEDIPLTSPLLNGDAKTEIPGPCEGTKMKSNTKEETVISTRQNCGDPTIAAPADSSKPTIPAFIHDDPVPTPKGVGMCGAFSILDGLCWYRPRSS